MPTEVAQLRPEGVEAAVEFAKSIGCELDAPDIDPMVSLVAKDGESTVAVVLGVHAEGACELHVCLGKLDEPGNLTGELLNKALMKVHGAGIRRCQITHHGADEAPADWPGAKWDVEDEPASDANAA